MCIETYSNIKRPRMHIYVPQQTIFLIWNMKLFLLLLLLYHWCLIKQKMTCSSKHWCWKKTNDKLLHLGKHLYYVCISVLHVSCLFIPEGNTDHLFCLWRLHILYFPVRRSCLFMFVCLALSACFCVSDPCVAPSPAPSFSTPYQKRERTLSARMYHPCQFSFHSPFLFFLLLFFCFTK